MFCATIIKHYLNNSQISDDWIDHAFNEASKNTALVLKQIGARSYHQALYQVKQLKNSCTCKDIKI